MQQPAIQIQTKGVLLDPERIAKLRLEFRDMHYVRLPQLLDPSLLDFLRARLANSQWETMIHGKIGEEYVTKDLPALGLLLFSANLPKFRAAIEELTGCAPLRWFQGRIYRMIPAAGHYITAR